MSRKQAKRRKDRKPRDWSGALSKVLLLSKLSVATAVIALGYQIGVRLIDQPIRAITVDGPFQRVSALQIEEAIEPELGSGFLSADLGVIRERITELTWIDQARVARRWPSTLEIQVTEQIPAACWGESGLLNTRGELFVTDARHVPAELPRLTGPEGKSSAVAQTYIQLRDRLIPMGLDLRRVDMDARGAWEVTLQNGVAIRLGRRDVETRIDLFIDVVADLVSSREAEVEFVDMRYSNGFSIGWANAELQPSPADATLPAAEMLAGTGGVGDIGEDRQVD